MSKFFETLIDSINDRFNPIIVKRSWLKEQLRLNEELKKELEIIRALLGNK